MMACVHILWTVVILQLMMKSCTGMDYTGFASFLSNIALTRITYLSSGASSCSALSVLGPYHALFDLQRVQEVLGDMLRDQDFRRLMEDEEGTELNFSVEELLHQITETLNHHSPAE